MGTIPTLPSFSAGQVLTASQLNQFTTWCNFWQTPPICRASRSVDSSNLSSGAWHLVTFDQDDIDNDNMHSTVSSTSRITIQTSGYYEITAHPHWNNNSTGSREAYIYKNNNGDETLSTGTGLYNSAVPASTNFGTTIPMPPLITSFTAGDYIELYMYQNSGTTLSIAGSSGGTATWLQVRLVGKV